MASSTQAKQYRFLHFYIHGSLNNSADFIEALQNLFESVTVLWADDNSGVIVEYLNEERELIDDDIQTYRHTIETIMADFYVTISLFFGTAFTSLDVAKDIYSWEKNAFDIGRRFLPNLFFIEKRDFIPHLLLNETSEMTKTMLKTILATENDAELIKTVKVFLECNLNATLAAKKLYIHRNSLQYRIDKFIEKTGIDIKQFRQAVSLYMLIVLQEMKGNKQL
ncbi:MAG: helix-turn-helix domain-containing protein [Bacillaceae bacterium]|nr:helix-turn-helix domain-containing protein [Bacillaceae bacterium]